MRGCAFGKLVPLKKFQQTKELLRKLSLELRIVTRFKAFEHNENSHRKINTLEEIEILKAVSSKYLLNDVIAGQNDPIYKLLPTSVI